MIKQTLSIVMTALLSLSCLNFILLPNHSYAIESFSSQNLFHISAGKNATAVVKSDGTVWVSGVGMSAAATSKENNMAVQLEGLSDVVSVSLGPYYGVALKSDGTVWTWNYSDTTFSDIDTMDLINRTQPVQVKNLSNIISISAGWGFSAALKSDGTVWTWGHNESGQLGNGTTTESDTPVQIENLKDVVCIAAGFTNAAAVKKDGTVWAWGDNAHGVLGDGTFGAVLNRYEPVQVIGLTDVQLVSKGFYSDHTLALKKDGTVWAWGLNQYGQLGVGSDKSAIGIPTQVKGLTNVVSIMVGENHSTALRSDGTVWTWGAGFAGELGNGTYGITNIPMHVESLKEAVAITVGHRHMAAIKNDGTVWAWGDNANGQFGDGTDNGSNIPVKTSIDLGAQNINFSNSPPSYAQASPTNSQILVDGRKTAFEAYNIKGNNCFKLRDIAMVLKGSGKQFEVIWDASTNAINVLTGKAYSPVGGEMSKSGIEGTKNALLSTSKIYIDGVSSAVTSYNINGNNYFKLRDLGAAIDFGVIWDGLSNTVKIDTSLKYGEELEEIALAPVRYGYNVYKWGYIDPVGSKVIDFKFDEAFSFSEGLALVVDDNKGGFINKKGVYVIEPQFDYAESFSEGLAMVEVDGKYGFIDKTGAFVVRPKYLNAGSFQEGLAPVLNNDGECGYIDQTGKIAVSPQFDDATNFSEGFAAVMINDKFGCIDKQGNIAIPLQYQDVGNFHEGLAAVQLNGKWGYLDQNGKMVITPIYIDAYNFSEGLALVGTDQGAFYIDKYGNEKISIPYDEFYDFSEGLAIFKAGDKYGFIDSNGNVAIKPQFDNATQIGFTEGLAAVCIDDMWGFVNKQGDIVVKPQYDQADHFAK